MADRSAPAPKHSLRLDAVALIALAGGLAVGAALVGVVTIDPSAHPLLHLLRDLAGPMLTSLGVGSALATCGWLGLTVQFILRRRWWVMAGAALGWTLLTAVSSTLGDYTTATLPTLSIFGAGGSIGAFLRIQLEHVIPAAISRGILLGGVILLGIALALPTVIRVGFGLMLRGMDLLVRGNRKVEAVNGSIVTVLSTLKQKAFAARETVVPLQPAPVSDPRPTLSVIPAADSDVEPESPSTTDDIPIRSHLDVAEAPLRIVPVEDEAAPVPADRYDLPPLSLLADPDPFPVQDHESALRERAALLEKTFTDFGLTVKVVGIHTGPVITQYEVALETGLRLNKVTTLADDLALNLKVSSVRVVAPLPGRNTVGIEVPNEHRHTVRLKELILATAPAAAKAKLPIFLGKDVEGRPLTYDLAGMPHLLIAGRTGTGKSVCLNSIILSLLYTRTPDECRMILIDPKKVELSEYGKIPHLMHPVVTDDKKAEAILAWAVDKMEERYEWLRRARVRNIASFNELGHDEALRRIDPQSEEERKSVPRSMPYIVIIIDEVGDLIMKMKKEIESTIILLAQKSRAAGIHLILATQKPTVDVITGLIKSNLPARICFQVASRSDSAVVLDEKGADKLLGMGDLLFLQPGTSSIIRAQGAFVSDREIEATVSELECETPNFEAELLNLKARDTAEMSGSALRERDPLYEQAIEIVIREQRGSTSLLQRALGVGYGRASRLIDFMAEDGIVGGYNGSNARDVMITPDEWHARKNAG